MHPQDAGLMFRWEGQSTGNEFRRVLRGYGGIQSRPGNCRDSAVAESLFVTLKNEESTDPYPTPGSNQPSITIYICGFYNPARLHSALDDQSASPTS